MPNVATFHGTACPCDLDWRKQPTSVNVCCRAYMRTIPITHGSSFVALFLAHVLLLSCSHCLSVRYLSVPRLLTQQWARQKLREPSHMIVASCLHLLSKGSAICGYSALSCARHAIVHMLASCAWFCWDQLSQLCPQHISPSAKPQELLCGACTKDQCVLRQFQDSSLCRRLSLMTWRTSWRLIPTSKANWAPANANSPLLFFSPVFQRFKLP